MANPSISRRQLFKGDLHGVSAPLRPPWALPEVDFTAACDRCGDCVAACGEQIIRVGDGGFPVLDFALGGCSFCGDCLAACGGKALQGDPTLERPRALVARIADGCLAFRGVICRSCAEACDESAVAFRLQVGGAAKPVLSADKCTGCGYCLRVCPVQAVQIEKPAHPGMNLERPIRAIP